MKVSKITLARLYNLGNYEHARLEISIDIGESDSPKDAIRKLNSVLTAANPKRPAGVQDVDGIERDIARLERLKAALAYDVEAFKREAGHFVGTPSEYIERLESELIEAKKAREEWLASRKQALAELDALNGVCETVQAKRNWDYEDYDEENY